MKKINLKTHYSFLYTKDTYLDVPDEIAELLKQFDRKYHADNEKRRVYKAYCSLDINDGIERASLFTVQSPEELLENKICIETIHNAILSLPEKQMKRIYAHFFVGLSYTRIAIMEGG